MAAERMSLAESTLLKAAVDPTDWVFNGDTASLNALIQRGYLQVSGLKAGHAVITATAAGEEALRRHLEGK